MEIYRQNGNQIMFRVGVLQFWWVCGGARCFESVLAGGKRGVGPAAVPELFCFSFKTPFKIQFYLFHFSTVYNGVPITWRSHDSAGI